MAKEGSAPVTEKVAAPAVQQSDFPLSLDEFCSQISITDKRVEAIGAFHATEKAAGRVKDTFPAYSGRYTAFLAKPM